MFKDFEKTPEEVLGKPGYMKSPDESLIALEFENETKRGFDLPNITGFTFHQEPSLRNFGFEYVMKKPSTRDNLSKLVDGYFSRIQQYAEEAGENPLLNSIRTSTHVHFDASKMTFLQIINWAAVYWLMENLLSEFCGQSRKGNHFCLRLKDATYPQAALTRAIIHGKPWESAVFQDNQRYASVNFASISKFGSLEFRMMRGLGTPLETLTWVDLLDQCRKFSLRFKTPRNLHQAFVKDFEAASLPLHIFGSSLYRELVRSFPPYFNVREEVRDNFLIISPLLLADKTWDFSERAKIEEEELQKKKKLFAAALSPSVPLLFEDYAISDHGEDQQVIGEEVVDPVLFMFNDL